MNMKENKKPIEADIAIVGAGASGMMAAISASTFFEKNNILNKKIVIIEKNDKAGKKILATGNGRCNLTNLKQNPNYYRTTEQGNDTIINILSEFDEKSSIQFFENHGMLTKNKDGYIYPKSMQAQTVTNTLVQICNGKNILFILNTCVNNINFSDVNKTYIIYSENEVIIKAKILIFSTGSSASAGENYNGYSLIKNMGHKIIKPLPALCGLWADKNCIADTNMGKSFFKQVMGVRCEVSCKAVLDNENISIEKGELQLTDYGLSGIVIFNLSHYITRGIEEGKKSFIYVDFIYDMTEDEIVNYLNKTWDNNINLYQAMSGILNSKIAKGLINILSGKYYNLSLTVMVNEIKQNVLIEFIREIKNFKVKIMGTNGFNKAQVCTGGVDLTEVSNNSLQSNINTGLFFCGELLDVDGICGGYNLQWAWSSGYVAGENAAEALLKHSLLGSMKKGRIQNDKNITDKAESKS